MRYALKLTSRQRVVRFIQTFWSEFHYAPTVQEVANGLGLGSRNAAIYHIRALRALGTVEWTEGDNRTIKLKEVKPWRIGTTNLQK